jgi:hypothetical protein
MDNNKRKMILPPDALPSDFIQLGVANAMMELAGRLDAQVERGMDVSPGFTFLALSEHESTALGQLLQDAKIPKELYDLRKLMKPANIVHIKRGGQG